VAVLNWAQTIRIKNIIIAAGAFHFRRDRWPFQRQLQSAVLQVAVDSVPVCEYYVTNWRRHEDGIVAIQNQILNYAYCLVKY